MTPDEKDIDVNIISQTMFFYNTGAQKNTNSAAGFYFIVLQSAWTA
jgi:hypothetical protein